MPPDTAHRPSPANLSERERIDRLRLIRTENVGPITFRQLLERYGSAERAIAALPDLARRGGRRTPLRVPSVASAGREVEDNARVGATLIVYGDAAYPPALAAVEDAPGAFSLIGHPHVLAQRAVAVVGARNASMNGRKLASVLSREIGRGGYTVVSGLARGIDAAAHEGSLESGTVAVVAGGIDVIYPPEHTDLFHRIAEAGAIVAEQPVGTTPQARHFPSRNRIIAGLSLGVLVVEAANRSGSLITARRALDQGREVFAVPGSPLDPRCGGTNGLIKEGAAFLVESADDVLRVLDGMPQRKLGEPQGRDWEGSYGGEALDPPALELDDRVRATVLDALSSEPVAVDELIRGCQLSAPIVATVLLEAELAGLIDRHPGNQVSRRMDVPA
ncbi:DNA-processing protein DprA [Thalassobaculum sp. OXR-137]|uniref:DNA-processing protein DprA n=1 Tax=Thalassobaculum sp. OXR-137 TaxID=3100173 RepID=UPI002AC9852F|nr:DNA-processing protein DprA [Thalassobaculum sp. OXR-137]WPZ33586.1 DNA-processing protein DprA [Thalassobaculum sp. OXR-137]